MYMNVDVNVSVPLIIQCMSRNMFYVLRLLNVFLVCEVIVYEQCIFSVEKLLLFINFM
jgi:hypothetical protein